MSSNATGKVRPKRPKSQSHNRQKKWKKKRAGIHPDQAAIPVDAPVKGTAPEPTGAPDEWPLYLDAIACDRAPVPMLQTQPSPEPTLSPPIRLSTNSVCPLCKELGQLNWHKTEDSPAILVYCLCPIGAALLAEDVNVLWQLGAPPLATDRYYAEIQFEPIPDKT